MVKLIFNLSFYSLAVVLTNMTDLLFDLGYLKLLYLIKFYSIAIFLNSIKLKGKLSEITLQDIPCTENIILNIFINSLLDLLRIGRNSIQLKK